MSEQDDDFRPFFKHENSDEFINTMEEMISGSEETGIELVEVKEYRDAVNNAAHFQLSNGSICVVPLNYFEELEQREGTTCRVCERGRLGFFFDFESTQILLLRCNKCKAKHTVADGGLCIVGS